MADVPPADHDTIDAAGAAIEKLILDDVSLLGWDNVSCARVLMNLRDRLDRMADKLLEDGTSYMDVLSRIK